MFSHWKNGVEKRISSLTRKSSEIRNFGKKEKSKNRREVKKFSHEEDYQNKVLIGICAFAYHHQLSHIKIWWCIEYSLSWKERHAEAKRGQMKIINHLHTIKNYGVIRDLHYQSKPQHNFVSTIDLCIKSITWHEYRMSKQVRDRVLTEQHYNYKAHKSWV